MKARTLRRLTPTRLLLALLIALTGSALQTSQSHAAEVQSCPLSPRTWERSLVSLATPTTPGWVGGDGFFSATLNESQTLFLNGDTFFGTRQGETLSGGLMYRNGVLVHDKRRPHCWITVPATSAAGVFATEGSPAENWYWPAEPLVREAEVMVPLSRWTPIPGWNVGDSLWNFQWADDELRKYKWDGAELRLMSTRKLDFDPVRAPPKVAGPMYWFGALQDGPWVYMFGTSARAGNIAHDAFLARVPTTEYFATTSTPLFPAAEFFTNAGWSKGASFADLRPIITAESDSTVSAVKVNGRYHLITKELSIFGDEVLDFHATSIEGPYERHVLADLPPNPEIMTYGASVHEVVDSAGSGRISLTVNQSWSGTGGPWDFLTHMDKARPILFEAQLPGVNAVTTEGSQFQPIQPARVFDSREERFGDQPIPPAGSVTIDVTDGGQVPFPADATAVAYNLTATGQTSSGYAVVTSNPMQTGSTSALNWSRAQETVTNGHVGALGADLTLTVHMGGLGSAHVVLDILGFYRPGTEQTSVFVPLPATRVYDSRPSKESVAAGTRRVIDFRGAGVPRTASAVAFNLTATGTGNNGYFAMAPGDTITPPPVSTLNWASEFTTVANASKVALVNGQATLFAATTPAHAVVDVFGYFIPASQVPPASEAYEFYPLPAERAYDSRDALNPLRPAPHGGAGLPRNIWAGLFGRTPKGAIGMEANVTVTGTSGSGYLRVEPAGTASATSMLNWTQPSSTRANAITMPLSPSGEIQASVANSGSHVIIDVSGYYR